MRRERQKRGAQAAQALGRSRGGFSTKIHALVSDKGRLVRYLLTGGEVNDITQADRLVTQVKATTYEGVVGDRAYDSNALLGRLRQLRLEAVIPSRANRIVQRPLAEDVYRRRNVIERWFGRLKGFRRIATRYEKTARSYEGFVALGALLVALSGWTV